jgi:hypothetical protein
MMTSSGIIVVKLPKTTHPSEAVGDVQYNDYHLYCALQILLNIVNPTRNVLISATWCVVSITVHVMKGTFLVLASSPASHVSRIRIALLVRHCFDLVASI